MNTQHKALQNNSPAREMCFNFENNLQKLTETKVFIKNMNDENIFKTIGHRSGVLPTFSFVVLVCFFYRVVLIK